MAFETMDRFPLGQNYHADFVLDSDEDVALLPTNCRPGSIAIVADSTGHIYIFAPSGTWMPFGFEAKGIEENSGGGVRPVDEDGGRK